MTVPMVECQGLVHIYKADGLEVVALQGLDLRVHEGEMLAIVGRSGSGKTTLMNILAGVEIPSAGRAQVEGWDLTRLRPEERVSYRRRMVGYVWQHAQVGLTPELTAIDNVQVALMGAPGSGKERRERASDLIDRLGLRARIDHRPDRLSGGEQQRLAIAVALANRPRVLLADEPTSQLDRVAAAAILEDLRLLQQELRTTVIMVTHDIQVERYVDRVIQIRDGRTSTETRWVETAGQARADELVIIDRAGRLQLPRKYVDALGLKDRVRLRLDGNQVVILPVEEDGRNTEEKPADA